MEGEERDDTVNEVGLHASIKGHVAGSCDICLDNVLAAVRHCETCSASLCERHLVDHGQNTQTAEHELTHPRQQAPGAVPSNTAPPSAHAGAPWTWLLMMVLVALVAVLIPYYGADVPQQAPVVLPESVSAAEELKACCQRVHLSAEEQKRNMAEQMCHVQTDIRDRKRAVQAHMALQRQMAEDALLDEDIAPFRGIIMVIMQNTDTLMKSALESLGGSRENDVDWCKDFPSAFELPRSSSFAA